MIKCKYLTNMWIADRTLFQKLLLQALQRNPSATLVKWRRFYWPLINKKPNSTSRGCTEQNDGQRMMSLTSLAWISSNVKILWSLVWRILLWANTQFVQRFSTQSKQRAVAWELSSQFVHFVGFWTAKTVSMLLMKKLSGNASIPFAGTGTTRWHLEQTRVRSWGLHVKIQFSCFQWKMLTFLRLWILHYNCLWINQWSVGSHYFLPITHHRNAKLQKIARKFSILSFNFLYTKKNSAKTLTKNSKTSCSIVL